jgi:hypothetical protein
MKLNLGKIEIPVVILVLLACMVSVYIVNNTFSKEEGGRQADSEKSDALHMQAGYIQVDVHVLEVNTLHEHLVLDLIFTPHGNLNAGDDVLSIPVQVEISGMQTEPLFFEAGKRMFPHEVAIDFYEGESNMYPFDEHKALLEMIVFKQDTQISIPTQLIFFGYHHGFEFEDVKLPPSSHGYLGFDINVKRSAITLWTSYFIMAIMWGLTFVNLFLLWASLTNRMQVDLGLFGYMSGFLVAMYFFRAIFPDIPPYLGVYADYLALFWVELVTAGIVIILAIKWFTALTIVKPETPEKKKRAVAKAK